jgi:hypothetical protein
MSRRTTLVFNLIEELRAEIAEARKDSADAYIEANRRVDAWILMHESTVRICQTCGHEVSSVRGPRRSR